MGKKRRVYVPLLRHPEAGVKQAVRTPLFLGSPDDVAEAESFYNEKHDGVKSERRLR